MANLRCNKTNFAFFSWSIIVFLILLSPVQAVEKLTINWSGLDEPLLENAKQYVRLNQEKPENLTAERIKYLYQVANEGILWSLRPFGYYNAEIKSSLTEPTLKEPGWQVAFDVNLKEPVKVQDINIQIKGEAASDSAFEQFILNFPLKHGDILNHPTYEKGKRALEELALERGYLDAQLKKHSVKVYKKSNQAQIEIKLDSGSRYCIAQVSFNQTRFAESVLQRYVPFKNGAPYDRAQLLQLRHNLMDSGYFKKVDIQKIKVEENKKQCVKLKITPELKKKDTYRGRIGYGTDTGVRFGVDARYNYLNRFGHSFQGSLGYTVKKKRHLARANYFIPVGSSTETFWKLSLGYKAEDFTSSDIGIDGVDGLTRVKDFSLQLSWHQPRVLFNNLKLDEVFSVDYLTESYELVPLVFPPELQDFVDLFLTEDDYNLLNPDLKVLSFGFDWSYQSVDNRIFANRGYRLDWGIKGASESLGSDVSYWQTRLKTKYIHRLNNKSRLLLRSDMAYTSAETVTVVDTVFGLELVTMNRLPKELLFATGGDNSIRGYEFEELYGVGSLPRAKHMLLGSIEYEYEIYPQWSLAAFYDVGNVFNKYKDFDATTGIGLGVRWHSPIGMVRLDIAHAKDREGSPVRLHFTIGPDF